METERSLPILQKPTIYLNSEHCCMTAARNVVLRFSRQWQRNLMMSFIIRNHNYAVNISEYLAVAMYSEPEVQVFPKQLKQLTTVQ